MYVIFDYEYMKILKTKEICAYLDRLKNNIEANYQNDYLDGYIEQKNEELAKNELTEAGQQEFKENPNISLFINSDEWNNNPYVKNIKFNNIKNKHFSYEKVLIKKGYLFNSDAICDDSDKELKDWLKLRALSKDIEALFLYQDNKEWMMAVPSEALTNDPYALKAHGNVITFGLGIGYFTYMALLNKNVKSITVIEKSKEVITLFNEIKNMFPRISDINIIKGDAFDYFNKDYLEKYDYIYVDIWKSSIDGRQIIEKLLEQYNPPINKCDFWIEQSCLNILRQLIFFYYDDKVNNSNNKIPKEYTKIMNKIKKYFDKQSTTIKDTETLKEIMYNRETIRNILAQNI